MLVIPLVVGAILAVTLRGLINVYLQIGLLSRRGAGGQNAI
jgi:hypothetical protein